MEDPNTGRDSGSATNRPNQQTDEIQSSEDRKPIDIPVEPVPETGPCSMKSFHAQLRMLTGDLLLC